MNRGLMTQMPSAKSCPRSWTYAKRPTRARSRVSGVILILSALVFARAVRVSSSRSSLPGSQARMWASCSRVGGGEVRAGALDLLGGVEQCAVVDADGVGVLVFDDRAVHERAEVPERVVVQVGAGDAFGDGVGEVGRDFVHVGEAVCHRDR